MPSSLIRFANRNTDGNGQKLHWGRADRDGLPFRGPFAPMYTEDEFESRTIKVADPHAEVFDISDPAQKTAYLNVLDGAANGWFQILYLKRPGEFARDQPTRAYAEWLEFFLEDGTMTPYTQHGIITMEQQNGAYPQAIPPTPMPGPTG